MEQPTKLALVTGGGRGLGASIARHLAAAGFGVILTYHSRAGEARQTVLELQAAGAGAATLPLSVDRPETFPAFFEALPPLLQQLGGRRLDCLVNNAGIGFNVPFASTTEDAFDQLLNVHFRGVYFFTQQALPHLNDGAAIVNLSSRLSRSVVPGYAAYASMKGAIETLSRYQAAELAVRGIRVNTVAPGPVATGFGGGLARDNEAFRARAAAMTALGRVGEPDDIGGVVAFLCSDAARWITGQRIEVSGGMNL